MSVTPRWAFAAMTVAALLSTHGGRPAAAQSAPAQGRDRRWTTSLEIQGKFRYDDNPFLLTSGQEGRLSQVSTADTLSGRFRDMLSATDVMAVPAVSLGVSGPGLGGRALEFAAGAAWEANVENGRRRHVELSLDVRQSVSRHGRLRFATDWRPTYFHKNYLADALDLNGDGQITRAERRYIPGTSGELELTLGYRHRLVRVGQGRPVGLNVGLVAGYSRRAYDAPFEGRSRTGPGATASVTAELGRRWSVGVAYGYAHETATATREILILDENVFGRDFNSNGSVTDVQARAFELVDRSRNERSLDVSLGAELRGVDAEVAYQHRTRDFTSTAPYDVANRGRRDTRNSVSGELAVRLARRVRLLLGGELAAQDTNRPGDPGATGEVSDYRRRVTYAGLRFRF